MTYDKIIVPREGSKITIDENQSLKVPHDPIIPFIEGDGIGPEITPVMRKVVNSSVEKAYNGQKKIYWMEVYCGEKAAKIYDGNKLPEETLRAFHEFVIGITRVTSDSEKTALAAVLHPSIANDILIGYDKQTDDHQIILKQLLQTAENMLRQMNWVKSADLISKGIHNFEKQIADIDVEDEEAEDSLESMTSLSSSDYGDAVIAHM